MLRFRHYSPTDRAACLAIFDSNCPRFLHPEERVEFEAWLDAPNGIYLVLEEHANVIACGGCTVEEHEPVLTLTWGLLHAEQHGRKLGELLLLERLVRGSSEGQAARSKLSTAPKTEAFFARVGYERTGFTPDGWGPGMHRVEMLLELDRTTRERLASAHRLALERHGMRPESFTD